MTPEQETQLIEILQGMGATIEELEKRVANLERCLQSMRQQNAYLEKERQDHEIRLRDLHRR